MTAQAASVVDRLAGAADASRVAASGAVPARKTRPDRSSFPRSREDLVEQPVVEGVVGVEQPAALHVLGDRGG
jgi:hypothetical protein